MRLTRLASVTGRALTVARLRLARRLTVGVRRTFLYHWVSAPFTGSRYSRSPSSTNHTGREIFRPDRRPVTVMVTSSTAPSAFRSAEGAGRGFRLGERLAAAGVFREDRFIAEPRDSP